MVRPGVRQLVLLRLGWHCSVQWSPKSVPVLKLQAVACMRFQIVYPCVWTASSLSLQTRFWALRTVPNPMCSPPAVLSATLLAATLPCSRHAWGCSVVCIIPAGQLGASCMAVLAWTRGSASPHGTASVRYQCAGDVGLRQLSVLCALAGQDEACCMHCNRDPVRAPSQAAVRGPDPWPGQLLVWSGVHASRDAACHA